MPRTKRIERSTSGRSDDLVRAMFCSPTCRIVGTTACGGGIE